MQYKTDFFMGIFLSMSFSSLGPLFQYLIFSQTRGYPRWNLKQIILFQGVVLLWLGIKDLLFGEIRGYVESMVKGGNFDRLLLKPYPPLGVILTSGFYYHAFGTIIAGAVIIAVSLQQLGLVLSWWQPLLFVGFFACGILLHMTITILYCIMIIRLTHMGRLGEIIDKLLQFSQYPLDILSPVLRMALMVFLPIAIWIYFPTEILLDRLEVNAFMGVAVALALFFASLFLWKRSLKRYTSAGG